ncbi:SDR family NAD(P)-dependent oxidoreductase [Nitriliruptor alkaliphilus]|uniref:SDR family NAD(P)-dependent oxidoreductase n=1 Tax=Nitriliruptor alkaliphilus TaxID=427918 RepID=UPI00069693A6|nr:SDR family oxidoreductase [Nitriliruptor alkaliphilus]
MTWGPDGKIAVVTGASSGIGEATTRRLAGAGLTVVAVARRVDRLEALASDLEGARGRVVPHAADVTDTEAVDALAARVRDEFGACHALINNAGIGGGAFTGREDLDDTLRTLDVNLLGTFRCLAAFSDLLEASAPSRVVNVASVAGKLGIGPAGYAASKFGVVGLSEALSLSWASRGITVCQLNPGFIVTEGFPQTDLTGGPLGRLVGEPEDVADRIAEVLRTGVAERTVPGWYRSFVAFRHVAPPLYRAIASRIDRAGGERRA